MTMLRVAPKIEGRRGSPRRLDEGGRYLGIPRNGDPAAPRVGSENPEAHNCDLLSVQETGCGTDAFLKLRPEEVDALLKFLQAL